MSLLRTKPLRQLGAFVALAGGVFGCSLILGPLGETNCETDADCAARASDNASFAGSVCDPVAHLCTGSGTSSSSGSGGINPDGDVPPACKTNQECADKAGGKPSVCVRSEDFPAATPPVQTHCAPLENDSCKIFNITPISFPNWTNDDAVVFGMIERLEASENIINLVKVAAMAFDEINRFGPGLPEASAQGHRRPIVFVYCNQVNDNSNAKANADFLANMGATGVIGPSQSDATRALSDFTLGNRQFLLATHATTPGLSDTDDQGLLWRVSPSAAFEGTVLKAMVADTEETVRTDLGLAPTDNIKVVFFTIKNDFGDGVANKLKENFKFNGGRSSILSTNEFLPISYEEPRPGVIVNFKPFIDSIIAFQPHIIVHIGNNELTSSPGSVIERIEADWTAAHRPYWLFNKNPARADGGLTKIAQNNASGIRTRIRGAYSRDVTPGVYATFLSNYFTKYDVPPTSKVDILQYSYDAAYVLAYAYYAGNTTHQKLTGPEIYEGAKKLSPNGPSTAFDVGPGGDSATIQNTFKVLQSGKAIDLVGATNNLNFDPIKGELPLSEANMQVFCFGTCEGASTIPPCTSAGDAGGTVVFKESGRSYDPKSEGLTGTFSCP